MNRTVVGIDVGTTKVCTMVAEVRPDGRINILGVGVAPSKGLDKGMVVNIDESVNAIRTSVDKAERLSGYRIGMAYVGIAGKHVQSLNSRGVVAIARPDHEITKMDVARAVESAQAVAVPTQREVIHVIPRAYIVDGHENIRDPIGMSGYRLEVETHIVSGEVMAIQNLIKSVERAGVEIDDLVLQPLASAEAVLTPEDKERGVVLVDIGGGTTDIAIFIHGGIWHSVVLPIGGNHFTNDIVYVLHTPPHTAEYLKIKYGSALAREPEHPEDDVILTESFAPGEQQEISRYYLNQIIQSRAEQLIAMVGDEIQRSGYQGMLSTGIVLTGGSSQLAGLDELAREMLGMPVRIGVPGDLMGLSETIDAPPYATGIGLLKWGLTRGARQPSDGAPAARESGNWRSIYERFTSWLKEFLP
jgi:cell division protein FtsA